MPAIYLYCICKSSVLPQLSGYGLEEQYPLFRQSYQQLSAVISEITLSDFTGPEGEAKFKDLSWIGPRALRHEAVIEQVMRHGPVLPVRFGAVFSTLQHLDDTLQKHHGGILDFLEDVADKDEWTVKGFLDREKAKKELLTHILEDKAAQLSALSPGMRYFQEQRIRTALEKDLNTWLRKIGKDIVQTLRDDAGRFCERRLLTRDKTGDDLDMVFHGAFLLPKSNVTALEAKIERINQAHEKQGVVFDLSGPWPPYSFSPALETGAEE